MTERGEQRTDGKKAVAFVHIPKAGGSTLHRIIDRQYPRRTILRLDMQRSDWPAVIAGISEKQKQEALCLRGHMPYGVHKFIARETRYITILRDPVKRFVSKYKNLLREPERAPELGIPLDRLGTLEDFTAFQVERNAMNFQTRMIAGYLDLANPLPPYPPLPADALEVALRNIERDFAVVGIMERFDESLVLMKQALGWGTLLYARQNVSYQGLKPAQIPQETLDLIRAHNSLDDEMYRWARAELDRKIEEAGAEFHADLRRTRNLSGLVFAAQQVYNKPPVKKLRSLARKVISR